MQYVMFDTAWGPFGFVTRDDRLVATLLPQPADRVREHISVLFPNAVETRGLLPKFRRQVINYFLGQPSALSVQVDLSGQPEFGVSVLKACRRIPYGRTASYADLARAVGKPGAARAVGGAMAHNPVPLVIPCHRVIRSDASLGGFSSMEGVTQKERLLRLENAWAPPPLSARRNGSSGRSK